MINPGKIRKLDQNVVNRIAAGEIIQRPANALKELIENSLDAKSTSIQISLKDGGLKFLQVQDNGTGIHKEDMAILCERFTTSKLQNFDDLKSIATFGFRGEALSSISHVAHLDIITKVASEKCAYRATYLDGKLKGPPLACAGNQGTVITAQNLFYNIATRRKALSNYSEEFAKVTEVVTKYAVHNSNVAFTLKKYGEKTTQVRTPALSSKLNNIRILYGNNVTKELLEISLDDKSYKFQLHAFVTNANYSSKKLTLLLFINHRLVQSTLLKKSIEDLYSVYLPKKTHPWCYISLNIDPENIDVNVHPTKHEVRFLHENLIIEKIRNALDEKLAAKDDSRTFYIQSKLPKVDVTKEDMQGVLLDTQGQESKEKITKIHPKYMIRTSSKDQKLDKFNFTVTGSKNFLENTRLNNDNTFNQILQDDSFANKNFDSNLNLSILVDTCNESKTDNNHVSEILERKNLSVEEKYNFKPLKDKDNVKNTTESNNLKKLNNINEKSNIDNIEEANKSNMDIEKSKQTILFKSYSVNKVQIETKLLSVLTLRKEVEETYHEGLRKIIADLIFVGCIDEFSGLIQSGVNLYICHTQKLVEELFYQIMLYDFANYGVIKFSESLLIRDLAILGFESEEAGWSENLGDKEELANRVQELLIEKADMLGQYFSIYIDKNGYLKSLPILLENYFPSQAEIPLYILRLSAEVNWNKEKPCFHDICRETARFYSHIDITNDKWKHITEHILYTAIKESLLPPKHYLHDSTILEIASLPDLYKVFERC